MCCGGVSKEGVRTLIDKSVTGTLGSVGEFGRYGAAGFRFAIDPSKRLAIDETIERDAALFDGYGIQTINDPGYIFETSDFTRKSA